MSTDNAVLTADNAFERRRGPLDQVQHALHRYPILSPLAVLVVSSIVFTIVGKGRFQSLASISTLLDGMAVPAALAIGQTLIILTAGIDLACGTAMLLTHVFVAKLVADHGAPSIVALFAGLVLALLIGFVHGFLVTRLSLPPFIVTLGTLFIWQAIGFIYSEAQTKNADQMGGTDGLLLWLSKIIRIGDLRISYFVLLLILLYALFAYILSNTAWGQHVYATGDDPEAARLAGVDTRRVLLSVYAVAGVMYGVAAWVQIGRAQVASMNGAVDVNLSTITAVVIGGTSLFGGRGRIWGTFIGALIVAVFERGLSLAEVDTFYRNLAIGMLIIAAVTLDQWIRRVAK